MIIDANVNVYKDENCNFDQHFISFQPKHIFIGKPKVWEMTEFSGAADNSSEFDGNNLLLQFESEAYVCISGLEVFKIQNWW